MNEILIGLGCNLGDREAMLRGAISRLETYVGAIVRSPIYTAPALLPKDAPADWNLPFLNMAIRGTTTLSPKALLTALKQIEDELGRMPRGRWGPREIDIDLLCYGDVVQHETALQLPHPHMLERAFVLKPVCDIAPSWPFPNSGAYAGKTFAEIAILLDLERDTHCTLYTDTKF